MKCLIAICLIAILHGTDAVTCPDAWVTFGNSCYFFGHDPLHFYEAEHYCQLKNAHLVHIESNQENTFLRGYMGQLVDPVHWIGLTDETVERIWLWTDSQERVNYTDWAQGQPNHSTHQNCVAMSEAHHMHYHWADYSCTSNFKPLCEISMADPTDPSLIVG